MYSGGLLVTTSNQWLSGSSEQVCVVAHGLNTTVNVMIQVQQSDRFRRRDATEREPVVYGQAFFVLPPGLRRILIWFITMTSLLTVVCVHCCRRHDVCIHFVR